jgi:hypothetical protein
MPHSSPLTVQLILAWADAHHAAHGVWPGALSGSVEACLSESWFRVDCSLRLGFRGLPGGDTLAKVLHRERAARSKFQQPPLTEEMILTWARAHHARHGVRPTTYSGPVEGVPGEVWARIDTALRVGRRGLPGGSSLAALLAPEMGPPLRTPAAHLTLAQVFAWADAHHDATGHWPGKGSEPVGLPEGESWQKIADALRLGIRGLPRGSTLGRLMRQRRHLAEGLRKCSRVYRPPDWNPGDKLVCSVRGEAEAAGLRAAPIPWPLGKQGRQRFLIVYGDLADAIRREAASTVALLWNVGSETVWRWRKALGVGAATEGTLRLKSENARGPAGAAARSAALEKSRDPERDRERREKIAAARRGKPRRPEDVAAAHAANRGRAREVPERPC